MPPPPRPQPARRPAPPAGVTLPPIPPNDMTPSQKAAALEELAREHAEQCPHCCPSNRGQLNLVFGEGDPAAALMFIGEGPGEEEDRAGRPFVGRSGQLLDKQIEAMGLKREQVYIANVVKIRPPGNRVPTPEEAQRCMPWLVRQIEIIHPRAIVTLGATPSKYMLANPALAITRERGQWKDYRGIPLMPTFHPAYLLRAYTPENRRRVWEDLQKVMELLGLPIPAK